MILILYYLYSHAIVQVDQMEHTMKKWSQSIDKLLMKHNWLLLFNISKILRLSKLLRSAFHPDSVAVNILEEISFLFCSDVQARREVVLAIKVKYHFQ